MEETNKNDWRRFALREMLRGFEYSEYKAALIFALSEANPGAAILSLMPDRLRFLDFLREATTDLRTLYDGVESFDGELSQNWQRYAAWYVCEWRGETIDVALLPNSYDQGEIVLITPNRDTLHDFAEAAHRFALRPKGRTLVYSEGWKNAPEVEAQMGSVTWDDVVLPWETLSGIREAIEGWAQSKAIYEDMGFSWRRGVLLIGPPGTGKTMIGKAAASALPDLPVLYVRDLREHNYRDALSVIFRRARDLAPCLLLLEDIDSILTPANRTVLLNEMDGFKGNDGVLVIASTNHPHKIDEAFLKRPSRFDRVFHIGLPAEPERAEFCRRILARSAFASRFAPNFDTDGLIARIVEKSKGFTPAYLKEALTGAALTLAHKGQAEVLDQRYTDAVLAQVDELKKTMRRLKDPAALAEMTTGETSIGYRRDSSD